MPRDQQFNFVPGANRLDSLRGVADQVGMTASELLRRMLDHCLQPRVLGELVPALSGQLRVGR